MPYRLGTDRTLLDIETVWAHLSTGTYWGGSRTRDEVEDEFAAAWRVVTAHDGVTGALVGFARAMSDGSSHARTSGFAGRAILPAALIEYYCGAVEFACSPGARLRPVMPSAEWHILEDRSGIHLQNVPLGGEMCSGARDYDVGIGGGGVGAGGQCSSIRNCRIPRGR
ncbi:hypothetical protein GCM10027167_39500 [Nocardia heshunensis]